MAAVNLVDGRVNTKNHREWLWKTYHTNQWKFTGEDGKRFPINKTVEYVVGVPGWCSCDMTR